MGMASRNTERPMKTSAETGQVWARNVADALTKKLNSFDCPFYWAKAGEDILKKEPTCLWLLSNSVISEDSWK